MNRGKTIRGFKDLVEAELARARSKHPGKQHSAHEGFGVLFEEVWEFFGEVMSQTPKTERGRKAKRARMRQELVQVAAMAQRTAEDIGLMDD